MTSNKENLSKFRIQIDEIDGKIIDLLLDRMEIVEEVGKHKTKNSATDSFIRAGREATMLRDLTKKAKDKFPPAAIATIWRMIISTSLCTEQGLSISAYVSENDNTCFWHAREYYGSFVNIKCEEKSDNIINDIANGKESIGILPLIDESTEPWWVRPNNEKNNIFVFAKIPFIESRESFNKPVLAIANVAPESTGDDISIISLLGIQDIGNVKEIFAEQHLKIRIIAKNNNSDYLIEIDDFLIADDERLTHIESIIKDIFEDKASLRLMGAYASTIKI